MAIHRLSDYCTHHVCPVAVLWHWESTSFPFLVCPSFNIFSPVRFSCTKAKGNIFTSNFGNCYNLMWARSWTCPKLTVVLSTGASASCQFFNFFLLKTAIHIYFNKCLQGSNFIFQHQALQTALKIDLSILHLVFLGLVN